MPDNDIAKQAIRLSFYTLFKEKGYRIEIPIIQRDYAQGRESNLEIRETFLDTLYEYLKNGEFNKDLDFVYGNIIVEKDHSRFIPLDGQQRLTTLFLLHWYLANISRNNEKLQFLTYHDEDKKIRSKFTYETRTSSKEFCDALVSYKLEEIDLKLLVDKKRISDIIKGCYWYFMSWDNDPTIKSMLVMLDSIHRKFSKNPEYFDLLVNDEKQIITFLFLELDQFLLSDDLYIKMNSRGRPLTPFENFKAKLEQHIGSLDIKKNFNLKYKNTDLEKKVNLKEYFSYKMDTVWINFFWQFCMQLQIKSGNEEILSDCDNEIMNFYRNIFTNEYACYKADDNLEYLMDSEPAKNLKNYKTYGIKPTFYVYNSIINCLTEKAIIYLINALDVILQNGKKPPSYLNKIYFDENEFFVKSINHKLEIKERVLYHAYFKYFLQNENESNGLVDWIRVIYNLVENTITDSTSDFSKSLQDIEKLLPYSNNILEYFRRGKIDCDFFDKQQIKEEVIKAHLFKRSKEWEIIIKDSEYDNFLKGQLGFLIEFSGVLEYYDKYSNCEWNEKKNLEYFNNFKTYTLKATTSFSYIESEKYANCSWETAVLSKGDYLIGASADRYNFLNTKYRVRDFSWKKLLKLPPEKSEEVNDLKMKRNLIKKVFDDPLFDTLNISKSLKNISKTIPNDWRRYFIEQPKLIEYCSKGFIRYYGENDILLFSQSQLNHYHCELFSYYFYLKYWESKNEKDKDIFKPFSSFDLYAVKSGEETACVYFTWTHSNANDLMDIRYLPDEEQYEVRYYNDNQKIVKNIETILKDMDMKKGDKYEDISFYFYLSKETEVYDFIKSLCLKLNQIKI
ncbi:hypothetical protein AGMMS50293_28430 [Spirochaetia bacterium]|nr:hypothetical protein AGMMS50293_28430 [Spirochaetia bacterium]